MTADGGLGAEDEMTGSARPRLVLGAVLTAAVLIVAACSGDEPAGPPLLTTPCFETTPGLSLPDDYFAADVSRSDDACLFVLQAEGLADTTAIAGELYFSSSGRTFEEFVEQMEENLAVGKEADILALQLLNTGQTGRLLEIVERREFDSPNRAVVFTHDSDRRRGIPGLSAVVDAPPDSQGQTRAIIIWGFWTKDNDKLIVDLINSIEFKPFQ